MEPAINRGPPPVPKEGEEPVDYAFYRETKNRGCERVTGVVPVIQDPSRKGRFFLGAPQDIEDLIVPVNKAELFLAATFSHSLAPQGELPPGQKKIAAVLFIGKTSRPESPLEPPPFQKMSLRQLALKSKKEGKNPLIHPGENAPRAFFPPTAPAP